MFREVLSSQLRTNSIDLMGPAATKLKVQHLSQILRLKNQVHNSDSGGGEELVLVCMLCVCGVVWCSVCVCVCVRAPISEIEVTFSFS